MSQNQTVPPDQEPDDPTVPQDQESEDEESSDTGAASADPTDLDVTEGDPPIIIQGGGSGTPG